MKDQHMALDFAASSDRGLVRTNNEDSAYAGPRLLALADGMGGHAAGEVASRFLVETLSALDSPLLDEPDQQEKLTTLLATAAEEGNQRIASHVDENPHLEGMGCTLTALLFGDGQAALCHVGDSRAYRLRDGQLEQITKDDTFVQTLVDEGKLDPADASSHPQRSLILKALTGRAVEPTLSTFPVQPGDRFMLCSDGLSDPVSADTMLDILSTCDPRTSADRLVEMALRGGGPDNVTVVVADVLDLSQDAAAPTSEPARALPDTPVLAGAAAPSAPDSRQFDTPASRAAASGARVSNSSRGPKAPAKRQPRDPEAVTSPEGEGQEGPATAGTEGAGAADADSTAAEANGGQDTDADAGTGVRKKRGGWIAGIIALVVALGLAAAGFVGYQRINDTYFLAVEDKEIVVKNGVQGSALGMALNSTYQRICLDKSAAVRLVSVDDSEPAGQDCHYFLTSDLTPSARSTLESMPEDSYQAIVEQVNRLAEQTLPVCVTREGASAKPGAKKGSQKKAAEDLTTPGVSCREVE